MKDGVRIGMAVSLGYLLGRTRKMRLALMLAGVGVSGKLGTGPAGLVKQGVGVLGSSPEVKTLTDAVRGRLVEAGKAAAISAVSSQVDTLTGKIEERAGSLSSPPVPGRAEEAEEETAEEETEEGAGRGEEEPEERTSARRPRRPEARRPEARRPRRAESADESTDDDSAPDGRTDGDRADGDRAADRSRRSAARSTDRRTPPVRRTRRREQ